MHQLSWFPAQCIIWLGFVLDQWFKFDILRCNRKLIFWYSKSLGVLFCYHPFSDTTVNMLLEFVIKSCSCITQVRLFFVLKLGSLWIRTTRASACEFIYFYPSFQSGHFCSYAHALWEVINLLPWILQVHQLASGLVLLSMISFWSSLPFLLRFQQRQQMKCIIN